MSYFQNEHILKIAKVQGLNVGKHPYQEALAGWRKIDRESRNEETEETIKSIFRDTRTRHPGGREKIHEDGVSQLSDTTRCN